MDGTYETRLTHTFKEKIKNTVITQTGGREWASMSMTRGDEAMNTLLRWDPISRTRWNLFKDRDELESRLATMFWTRAEEEDLWRAHDVKDCW